MEAIDRTWVSGPKVILLGLLDVVTDRAFSFRIVILVFVVTTFVGSAPIDKDMVAFPTSYTGSSNTEVRVFGEFGFGVRLSITVANFEESKLIDNFTKET